MVAYFKYLKIYMIHTRMFNTHLTLAKEFHFRSNCKTNITAFKFPHQNYLAVEFANNTPSCSCHSYIENFNMASPINASTSYFDKNVPKVVLKSLFMKYDVDGSGVLNQQELRQLFEGDLGMKKDEAEAYSMLLDKDGSQTVSFEELHQWLSSGEKFQNINDKSRFYRLKTAVQMFKKFDADGNGTIEKDEFTKLMIEVKCPSDKIQEALKSLDKDGNGKISFPEFLKWLNWLPN